jgi:hypothetical protein
MPLAGGGFEDLGRAIGFGPTRWPYRYEKPNQGLRIAGRGKGAGEWRRYASAEEWSPSPDAMALVGLPTLGRAVMGTDRLDGCADHQTP